MSKQSTLTPPKLVFKLWLALSLLILGMAACYILVTTYFSNQHHLATQQEINAPLAQHLIDEKFADASPFMEDGSVNKAVFGDLMHDMMAVNRSIEVYLLGIDGEVLHSVVLEHSPKEPALYVDTKPITDFIESDYKGFCLGDDPRDRSERKIFSVAPFENNGRNGYIYIILSGEAYQLASSNIFNKYIKSFGLGAIALTTFFTLLIGFVLIWFITKNLRTITQVARRFKEGDLYARIEDPEKTDVAVFAHTFNDMADTINENLEEIKSVDELRRQLIANVSHDLRTPLAVLKGYADTLQEKSSSLTEQEKNKYLNVISSNSDKLTNLVEQLFEYSKLEAKQIEPLMEQFSITDLCLDLVSKYDILAKKKNIDLSIAVKNNENILVYADISLIERALQNLIDNALKFTPDNGSIRVELEKSGEQCLVKVNDSGIGIAPEMQSSIFERFKQSSESFAKNGAGLGLAIVKKILDLHQSTITVMSKQNSGSTFKFNLPVA
ncbi:two-component sensor histidine kinase [Nonlabens ulvanivorans]|uniref:histidine kinase n=3 Tax=Nonlabens ulvanivorans TaxID=906888 RepID=A0A081DDC2_NONUL|nr:HAMP domain-containing sensor histidine kinase [Nonlabens ulvanivorans]GAK76918.1 two-component sensor histidine kinase [Nonlabens ulvanivorans]